MIDKRDDLLQIAQAAICSVSPYGMIKEKIKLHGDILSFSSGDSVDLSKFDAVYVIGAGKATAPMAKALEEILGNRITDGAISIKPGHTAGLKIIRQIEGGHPVPTEGSIDAAAVIADLAKKGGEKTLFLNCISGGGSALLTLPFYDDTHRITLADMQETTKALLFCGATIYEINCIRKHLSGIKGGRLAERIYPARSISLILSDVVGDDLQSIASGLTVPDKTTFQQAMGIIEKYGIAGSIPIRVMELITDGVAGYVEETPSNENPCFTKSTNVLLGTNALALRAAAEKAGALGYNPFLLTSRVIGEAREIAKFYAGLAQEAAASAERDNTHKLPGGGSYKKPVCILAGGETTVTIRGNGKGGRNQEMALAFLSEVADRPEAYPGILFASVATDGNDGPTDAAGGFASVDLMKKAEEAGMEINGYLADNDAYSFFSRIDGLIKTGPTNTNVCDLQIILSQ
ncbi:MAG: DUF4147 domain-containing protein [candidate division Zixibacteria bacterium]|nr:DUF4147 domain-containing protein [candidate division Zixibacteria bacterium]